MWSPITVRSSVNGYSGSLHVTNALPLASVAEEAYKLCVVFDYVATTVMKGEIFDFDKEQTSQ